MKINRKWLLMLLCILLLGGFTFYWFYFAEPTALPTDEQLILEMNEALPDAKVSKIQDKLYLDERHVFVPFISESGNYGTGYYVWAKHKWYPASVDTIGEPRIWKIERDDPSTYRFVWNINPYDEINYVKFYLKKSRNYFVSAGVERYFPEVQLENKVSLQDKTYGIVKLPKSWREVIQSEIDVVSAKNTNVSIDTLLQNSSMYFGYTVYDKFDREAFQHLSIGSSGFTNGDPGIEHVRRLNVDEIISP